MKYNVFISYAGEDKKDFVEPLAQVLRNKGLKVWFAEFNLKPGKSLRRSIDEGLANSRYGIVVLSKYFFGKRWPERELDGLFACMEDGEIIPVWHNVTEEDVKKYSPMLAGVYAVKSANGMATLVTEILETVKPEAIDENDIIYENLEGLKLGTSCIGIDQVFGRPLVTNLRRGFGIRQQNGKHGLYETPPDLVESCREKIYQQENFFLKTICDSNDSLVAYGITARKLEFRPRIPLTLEELPDGGHSFSPIPSKFRINQMELGELWQFIPEPQEVNMMNNWSRLMYYIEGYYVAVGIKKYYFFSMTPFGEGYEREKIYEYDKLWMEKDKKRLMKDSRFKEWRSRLKPNSFAISYPYSNFLFYLLGTGISPTYDQVIM